MKRTILLFLILLLFVVLVFDVLEKAFVKEDGIKGLVSGIKKKVKKPAVSERVGEKISYDIKIGGLVIGRADFSHQARFNLKGRAVNLMTFNTKVGRFNDMERVYSDAKTFLPVKVERDIRSWPNREKIIEDYDQEGFTLKITKSRGRKSEEVLLKKSDVIHNAILLPFLVRRVEKLEPGWAMEANLPTSRFEIKLDNIEEVAVPAGKFKSYHFISNPSRFEIWIGVDKRRIPLKIRGLNGIGYTLSMKEYSH